MRNLTAIIGLLLLAFVISNAQAEPIVDEFWLAVDPDGIWGGGGSGFNGGGWYVYPNSGWINKWFYDHPYEGGTEGDEPEPGGAENDIGIEQGTR